MSEYSEMTCAELADVAAELALGVLTGRERALAVAHLDECDACREDVRQLMATGEQLLELLPSAEPPAGFETRVLERLGLPAPPQEPAQPAQGARRGRSPRRQGPAQGGTRPGSDRPRGDRPRGDRPRGDRLSGTRRPGRMRRALAATAVGLAVIAAGLGGWRIGVGTTPAATSAAGSLTSASLLSTTHQTVGNASLYSGTPWWLYMFVDVGSGREVVTCQLMGANGQVTTLGSFRLANGYGAWVSRPNPGNVGDFSGARLISATGAVLATATFTH
jgi:hypothetical protein